MHAVEGMAGRSVGVCFFCVERGYDMLELIVRYGALLREIALAQESGDWAKVIERADRYRGDYKSILLPYLAEKTTGESQIDLPPEVLALLEEYRKNPPKRFSNL